MYEDEDRPKNVGATISIRPAQAAREHMGQAVREASRQMEGCAKRLEIAQVEMRQAEEDYKRLRAAASILTGEDVEQVMPSQEQSSW